VKGNRKLSEWVIEPGDAPLLQCLHCSRPLSPGENVVLLQLLDADRAIFSNDTEASVLSLDTYMAGVVSHAACADAAGV
jgi:hypothetical protein